MDRFVIKGRGPNRGKYLCYSRMAGLPAGGDYVWLPEQSKAMRVDEPTGYGHCRTTKLATENNGYAVKLTARKSVIARVSDLQAYIRQHAAGAKERPDCYWLDGDWSGDEGPDYCWECACKKVDTAFAKDPQTFVKAYGNCHREWKTAEDYYRSAIDGGWSMDHDSTPHCETCGVQLDGTLTDYGADEEIQALTTNCKPTFDDVEEWYCLNMAVMNIRDDDPRWNKIASVVDAAIAAERLVEERQADLAASPGMSEARSSLLGLLAIRQEQKAPEPSYRLWDEFVAWRSRERSGNESPDDAAIELRLIDEAKLFAKDLGFYAHWSGDLFMIKAPYGTYYWPFVVEIEQYRLWQPPAFLEGRAHWHKPWDETEQSRDANPYPKDSLEYSQWDCGYMSASMTLPDLPR